MKKMRFLMVGLMLSAVLVMTAVGCDNDSSSLSTLNHAVLIGTWDKTPYDTDANTREKIRLIFTADRVTQMVLKSVSDGSWIIDSSFNEEWSIISSTVVGSAVTIVVEGDTILGTLSNNNNTFTVIIDGSDTDAFFRV